MEKKIENNEILVISHIDDIDGMGGVILGYLAFKSIDYLLIEVSEQEEMLDFIKSTNYKQVYITDIGMQNKIADEINALNKNILLFDHHITSIYADKYPFATVKPTLNNRKTSATELFYDYLIKYDFIKRTETLDYFVELIRSNDTWDWYKDGLKEANDLGTLFTMIGTNLFINYYIENLMKLEKFSFSKEQRFLIDLREKEINELIESCNKAVIKIKFENLTAGVIFSDRCSSRIGNSLCNNLEIDFAMIINTIDKRVSLRSIGDRDVSIIAQKYQGGGHKNAAGFRLTDEIKKTLFYLVADGIK